MDLGEMFPPRAVEGMRARLREVADGLGLTIGEHDHAPSTKPALVMSEHARGKGRLAEFRAVTMDAYWRDGRDIEDRAVLATLAESAGLDPDEALASLDDVDAPAILLAQRREAMMWGVRGIPTWFMLPTGFDPDAPEPPEEGGPQAVKVVGCQPMDVVERAALLAGATPLGGAG
jgi:predicted DsbA family dithiol-disulfide isomerase